MLFGAIDDDKNKNLAILGSDVSLTDVGPGYTRNGIVYEKITNGVSWRYRPVLNQMLPVSIVTPTMNDSTGTTNTLVSFKIPGNILHKGDYILLSVVLTGDISTALQIMAISSIPSYGTASTYKSGGSLSFTLKIEALDSNVLLLSQLSGFSSPNGASDITSGFWHNLLNTLDDMSITISQRYSTTGLGKSVTVSSVTAEYKSTNIVTPIVDQTPYRQVTDQWFSNDSPWNLPLAPQAVRGAETHPLAIAIRDKYFGRKTKTGSGTTIVHWAMVQRTSSTGPHHIPVLQAVESDLADVYVRPNAAGAGISPHAPYFIRTPIASTTVGYTYKVRIPNTELFPGQVGDKAMVIITPCKRFAVEMGSYGWNATLKRHECNRLAIVDLYAKGFSYLFYPFNGTKQIALNLATNAYGYNKYYRAGGNPFMGGIVRKSEIDAGDIPHMIAMMISDYIGRGGRYTIVSATGNTFVVKSGELYNSMNYVDYSSIFGVVNLKVRITSAYWSDGGTIYTTTGAAVYDPETGYTTFTVNETIGTYSGTTLLIGSTSKENFDFSYVWPMVSRDASGVGVGYWGIIPMGQVYTYPADLNTDTGMGLTNNDARAVARAIKKYGAMVMDVAGNTTGICQCDQDWTDTQRSNITSNASLLIARLVPVTNYDKTLYAQALADTTIAKPKPILPFN